jgi:hypothetical protein
MKSISMLAAVAALSATAMLGSAQAAPVTPHTPVPGVAANGGVLLVHDGWYRPAYPHCRGWARECAGRWGWRTWRWGRCMRLHGC